MSLLLLGHATCYSKAVVSFALLQKINKKLIHLCMQIQLPITWKYDFTKHNIPKLLGLCGQPYNTKLPHETLLMRCSFDSPQSKVSSH